MEKQIRDVNQARSLPFDRRLNARMIVPKRIHSNPTQEIEILFALGIPEIHAASTNKKNGLTLVCRKQKLRFHARSGFETDGRNTSEPHANSVNANRSSMST